MVTMISRANKLVEIESMFVVYLLLRGWAILSIKNDRLIDPQLPRGVQSC